MPERCLRAVCGMLIVSALLLPALPAFADDDVAYSSLVVQNRKNFGTHEFGFNAGSLPLDAFTKGYTLGGSYTLHFTEQIAWEVAQAAYSFHVDTDLKDELKAFDLRPTPFELIEYYAMSNVVWKPVYWKGSWLNDSLIYGELFFIAGGGYGWFTRSSRPGGDIGAGFRLYANTLISFRFDARYLFFFDDTILDEFQVKDDISVSLGTSLTF